MTETRLARTKQRIWTPPFKLGLCIAVGVAGLSMATIGQSSWQRGGADEAAPMPARMAIREGVRGEPTGRIDYARLDQRLSELASSRDMVGLAIAIVEHGQLSFVKGYGVTAAEDGQPVTAHTVFRWASLSKGVASTMIGELADEKRLSLDDPVARYAPSLRLPGGAERVVTIEDLLSHRVGIVKNAYDDKLEEGFDPRVIRTMLGGLDPYCPPRQCFAYQNIAYDAASEIVHSVTRQNYVDAVRQRLFLPLGMTSASLTREGLVSARSWARPHVGARREVAVEEAYYRVPAAGGVNSSVLDLGTWMRAQMGEAASVLPRRVLDTIHAPRVSTASARRHVGRFDRPMTGNQYALGWRDFEYEGHPLIGHRGAVRGYRSLLSFDPKTRDGVALLWNSESIRPVGVQLEIFDMLYQRPAQDWLELDTPRKDGTRGA